MTDIMNAREVKKVIEASIFNPTMRRDAKDFVDGLVGVVDAAQKLITDWRTYPEPEDKYDLEAAGTFETCAAQLEAVLAILKVTK